MHCRRDASPPTCSGSLANTAITTATNGLLSLRLFVPTAIAPRQVRSPTYLPTMQTQTTKTEKEFPESQLRKIRSELVRAGFKIQEVNEGELLVHGSKFTLRCYWDGEQWRMVPQDGSITRVIRSALAFG